MNYPATRIDLRIVTVVILYINPIVFTFPYIIALSLFNNENELGLPLFREIIDYFGAVVNN